MSYKMMWMVYAMCIIHIFICICIYIYMHILHIYMVIFFCILHDLCIDVHVR